MAMTKKEMAPSIESARKMGEEGGPAVEAERLAFEAWRSGHCWVLGATWNAGSGYVGQEEVFGLRISQQATETRRSWAAWRDRAALASDRVEQLRQECNLLADVLRDAYEVIKTVEGENSDEDERLWDLRMVIEAALSGYDKDRIEKSTKHDATDRIEQLETALRLAADEPNIDRARAIADAALKEGG